MKKSFLPLALITFLLFSQFAKAQQDLLRSQIIEISNQAKGIVGVSILGIESRDTLNYNGSSRLVMQSVMKLPIAMTILSMVDKGKYKLDQKMKVSKGDMFTGTLSPMVRAKDSLSLMARSRRPSEESKM